MKAYAYIFGGVTVIVVIGTFAISCDRAYWDYREKSDLKADEQVYQKQVAPLHAVFLYEEDTGKTVTVKPGDVVLIILTCDDLIHGYQWTPMGEIGHACQLAGLKRATHHQAGKSWKSVLTITPVEAGTSVVNLQQQNLPGNDVLKRTFTVTLNVNP